MQEHFFQSASPFQNVKWNTQSGGSLHFLDAAAAVTLRFRVCVLLAAAAALRRSLPLRCIFIKETKKKCTMT